MPSLKFSKPADSKTLLPGPIRDKMLSLMKDQIDQGLRSNLSETKIRNIVKVLAVLHDFKLLDNIPEELGKLFTYSEENLDSISRLFNLLEVNKIMLAEYCLDIILLRVDATKLIVAHKWKGLNTQEFHANFMLEKERLAVINKRLLDRESYEVLMKRLEAKELAPIRSSQSSLSSPATTSGSPVRSEALGERTPIAPSPLINREHFGRDVEPPRVTSPEVISVTTSTMVSLSEILRLRGGFVGPLSERSCVSSDFQPVDTIPNVERLLKYAKFVP